jgi:hypothetical protein
MVSSPLSVRTWKIILFIYLRRCRHDHCPCKFHHCVRGSASVRANGKKELKINKFYFLIWVCSYATSNRTNKLSYAWIQNKSNIKIFFHVREDAKKNIIFMYAQTGLRPRGRNIGSCGQVFAIPSIIADVHRGPDADADFRAVFFTVGHPFW